MELNSVPAAKSLTLFFFAALAGNTRSSPALGAISPTQFAAVVHLLSAPPPSQTKRMTAMPRICWDADPICPINVAAPVDKLIENRLDVEPDVRDANALPSPAI